MLYYIGWSFGRERDLSWSPQHPSGKTNLELSILLYKRTRAHQHTCTNTRKHRHTHARARACSLRCKSEARRGITSHIDHVWPPCPNRFMHVYTGCTRKFYRTRHYSGSYCSIYILVISLLPSAIEILNIGRVLKYAFYIHTNYLLWMIEQLSDCHKWRIV